LQLFGLQKQADYYHPVRAIVSGEKHLVFTVVQNFCEAVWIGGSVFHLGCGTNSHACLCPPGLHLPLPRGRNLLQSARTLMFTPHLTLPFRFYSTPLINQPSMSATKQTLELASHFTLLSLPPRLPSATNHPPPMPNITDRKEQVVDYVRSIKGSNIVLTGHSLGGGLARIVAALERTASVCFSPPGIAQSYRKFRSGPLAVDRDFLHHSSVSVIPEHDFIPMIDTQVGLIQTITCSTSSKVLQNSCHMLEGTLCEFFIS
ncbi:unnamed protein product, partial [Phaeothamnion confervicola]